MTTSAEIEATVIPGPWAAPDAPRTPTAPPEASSGRRLDLDPEHPLTIKDTDAKRYLNHKSRDHAEKISELLLPSTAVAGYGETPVPTETELIAAFRARLDAVFDLAGNGDSRYRRDHNQILFGKNTVVASSEGTVSMLRFDFGHTHTEVVLTEDPRGERTPHLQATNYDTPLERLITKIPVVKNYSQRIMEAPRGRSESWPRGGRRERYEVGGNPTSPNVVSLRPQPGQARPTAA